MGSSRRQKVTKTCLDGVLKAEFQTGTSWVLEMTQVWRRLKEMHELPPATPLDVSSPNGASYEVYLRALPVGLFLRAASTSSGSGEQQPPAW